MMDDTFGHWLAGFVDGEGCFCIAVNGQGAGRLCSLNISLRSDDRAVLEEIQRQTGLGKVYDSPGRGTTQPYSRWIVQRQAETQEVVKLFTRYPLRAKKAADFVIWKQAVAIWCTGNQGNPAAVRWPLMDALKAQLIAIRQFDTQDLPVEPHVEPPQLRIVDIA